MGRSCRHIRKRGNLQEQAPYRLADNESLCENWNKYIPFACSIYAVYIRERGEKNDGRNHVEKLREGRGRNTSEGGTHGLLRPRRHLCAGQHPVARHQPGLCSRGTLVLLPPHWLGYRPDDALPLRRTLDTKGDRGVAGKGRVSGQRNAVRYASVALTGSKRESRCAGSLYYSAVHMY